MGTRGSALALVQARWVADRLERAELVEIVTSGDQAQGVGDKSRWVDAIVLAAAGLARLGVARDAAPLDFVPAPGQGTLAIEARDGDERVSSAVAEIHHAATFAHLDAERAAVRVLAATCHTPVGIHARDGTIRGFVGLPDGSEWVADELPAGDGEALARRMIAAGAGELLARAEALE